MNNLETDGLASHPPDAATPLVPPEVDLSSFPWAPVRLDFLAGSPLALLPSAEPFRALVLLITVAWRQRPAMTAPDDDAQLASMAGFGRDVAGWAVVRPDVLRDWILASDGRWHHPELAAWAMQAWASKKGAERFSDLQRERALIGAARRQSSSKNPSDLPDSRRGSAVAEPYKKEEETERIVDREEKIVDGEKRKSDGPAALSAPGIFSDGFGDAAHPKFGSEEVTQSVGGGDLVVQVFEHWKSRTERPGETLTPSRRRIIQARLNEGIPWGQILRAIDAAAASDFHQGRLPKQPQRMDTLDVICRSADSILRLAGEPGMQSQSRRLKSATHKTAERIKSMMARLHSDVTDVDMPPAPPPGGDAP